MAEATAEYKVIGTRPIRPDGADKVTGRAVYGGDMRLTGMLHGKVLRSPHAHARIKSINTAKAEALPGVKTVITVKDFPVAEDRMANLGEMAVNVKLLSNNVMAADKVLYKGHAVAAVAATNAHIAEEALGLIEVEYEVLPPVLDVLDAMKDTAPLLHESMTTTELGQKTEKHSNIASHLRFVLGDPAQGFRDADIVIEREFETATVHQGYIEPHNATALWNEDGHLYIWTSTQGAFVVQRQAAEILGLPVSQVSVTPCEIGGGFGGKISVYLEPVAAVLSRKAGRPVKIIMSRIEEFEATGPTPASHIKVKMGAKKDGRLVAAEASLMYEAGAFPGSPVGAGCMCIFSPYAMPLTGPNRGRGVASGFWFNVGFQSTVVINVNADGTVSLVEGSTDIGGTRASIAMQAAETLGIPYEDVRPTVVGTDGIGFTDVTGGSRTTFATGYAAHEASLDVLRQMKERLARRWDGEMEKEVEGQADHEMARITPDDVTYTNGVFKCAKDASKTMTFKEVTAQMARMGGPITGRATSQPRGVGGAFATHIVDVEVDPDTGKVTILRYTAVQDAGRAIHPSYVEGQIQGGAVQCL